jgi:uncharacterized protein YneF (UPF0154 family)
MAAAAWVLVILVAVALFILGGDWLAGRLDELREP